MTLVPAAQQLADQVTELREGASYTVDPEVDGLGFHRTVIFDKDTAEWLAPILDVLKDERIHSYNSDEGDLAVNFVGDTRADFAQEYDLAGVDAVLNEDKPTKKAAKKA